MHYSYRDSNLLAVASRQLCTTSKSLFVLFFCLFNYDDAHELCPSHLANVFLVVALPGISHRKRVFSCPRKTTNSRGWRTKTDTSGGSPGKFSRRAVACRATLRRLRCQFTCAHCTCKRAQPFHRSPAPDRVFLAPPPKKKDKAAGSFAVWGGNRCRFLYVFVAGF
jgi:hypothetical protein